MTEKDKDFLEGLAISAACHVLPVRKVFREPIAYSYNGVILPKLPEWDRERYPYAFIFNQSNCAVLRCTNVPVHLEFTREYIEENNVSTPIVVANDGETFVLLSYGTTKNGELVAGQEAEEWTIYVNGDSSNGMRINIPILWSNYGLCYSDGEIHSAASEPIPIYE